jgi:hypothetical protein
MTRTLSILTARKSLSFLSGLFSLALLLFSGAGVHAQGGCGLDSEIKYEKPAEDTASSVTDFMQEKVALREKIAIAKKGVEWFNIGSRSVDDGKREQEAATEHENALAEYKKKFQIEYDKDQIGDNTAVNTNFPGIKIEGGSAEQRRAVYESLKILPNLPKHIYISPSNGIIYINVVETLSKARNLSSQMGLLDAATRKSVADKNSDGKKLRSSFLDIKRKYDESVTNLAAIYVKTEENPNADQSVISSIDAELSKGDDYFSERFRLELDKLKNHISDEDYQLKKIEIDDRYAQKYMLAAAHLGADDVAWMLTQLSSRVETLRKLVDTLKENEPVLRGWFLGLPALATPFLVYLLFRKKESEESPLRRNREWREASEFELMELKKRQLENANIKAELEIEKEKIELERLKKTEIIIYPTADEIKKYSAPAFFRRSDENKNERDNYSGH